jgi:hypothetical protein
VEDSDYATLGLDSKIKNAKKGDTPIFEFPTYEKQENGKYKSQMTKFKPLVTRTLYFTGQSKYILPYLNQMIEDSAVSKFVEILKTKFSSADEFPYYEIASARPAYRVEDFSFGGVFGADALAIGDEVAFDDSFNSKKINFKYIDYKTIDVKELQAKLEERQTKQANAVKPKDEEKEVKGTSEVFKTNSKANFRTIDTEELGTQIEDVYKSEYVLKNFKPKACWFSTLIDIFKSPIETKYPSIKITYETLYEMVYNAKYTDDVVTWGASFNQVVQGFFKRFRVAVYLFDINYKIRCHYDPEDEGLKRSSRLRPQVVYFLYHDHHIYHLNSDLKSLEQVLDNYFVYNDVVTKPTTSYYLPKPIDEDKQIFFVNDCNDLIQATTQTTKENITCVFDDDLLEMWRQLYYEHNYEATMIFEGSCVTALRVNNINKKNVNIINLSDEYTADTYIESQEEFKHFEKAKNEVSRCLLSSSYLSSYSEQVFDILNHYKRGGVIGAFRQTDKPYGFCVDFNKFYTSILCDMPSIPVINAFDNFEVYDNHTLEPMTIYLVEKLNDAVEYPKNKVSLCYGQNLMLHQANVKITAYLRPSKSRANISKVVTKKVYDDEILSEQMKKNIMNSVVGMMSKKKNKKHYSKVFTDIKEARNNVTLYGGVIQPITVKKSVEYVDDIPVCEYEKIYVHYLRREEQLDEGFYLLSLYIYDTAEAKLFQLKNELESVGLSSYGCNTDCHYVEKDFVKMEAFKAKYPHYFAYNNLVDSIGKLKVEVKAMNRMNMLEVSDDVNVFKPVEPVQVNQIDLVDEWDREELKQIIYNNRNLVIKADIAGAGKTSSFVHALPNALYICPWNTLCLNLIQKGLKAITFNRLFGINFDGESESLTKGVDVEEYSDIVFDEVYLYNTNQLAKIQKLIKEHPSIRFYATGDENQNKPIETLMVKDIKTYYNNIVHTLFSNCVLLQDNKRCDNKDDQQKIKQITKAIREGTKEQALKVCVENFKIIKDVKAITTKKNIVAYNATAEKLNKLLHKGEKYFVGLELICRKTYTCKGVRTYVNYTYTIEKIEGKMITLNDGTNCVVLSTDIVNDCFRYPYARTCHSYQGTSEDEPITIFDVTSPMADNDWLYTAITRTTKLENIHIYLPATCSYQISNIIKSRIQGHLEEDIAKKRYINNDFVDPQWVCDKLKECRWTCCLCHQKMDIEGADAFSVDRLDNNLGHIKSNCQVICRRCNSSKK